MIFPRRRSRPDPTRPEQGLTVRSHRSPATLLERLEEGDLAVIDQRDLDAAAARALLARRPAAVVNASEFISGRFANLGPRMLVAGGVTLLEGDREQVLGLRDGSRLRYESGTFFDGDVAVPLREVSADEVTERMDAARAGLASQLDTFAHTASEFLRREEALLLHGTGLPTVRAELAGRSAVVVGPETTAADLRRLRTFVREQRPVLIAVDAGAETLRTARLRPDVLVLTGEGVIDDKSLARSREVVLTGSGELVRRRLDKLNLPRHTVATGAAGTDVGLLLAHHGGASLLIPVGTPSTLEDFIDRSRSDQASNVMARLRLASKVVDADAVPLLYTGRVRGWHVVGLVLLAAAVLAVTVAATPIGNGWWQDLRPHLPGVLGR